MLGQSSPADWEAVLREAVPENARRGAERQEALRRRRKAAGLTDHRVWLSPADYDALRARFPGPRGGVDWGAAVDALLGRAG